MMQMLNTRHNRPPAVYVLVALSCLTFLLYFRASIGDSFAAITGFRDSSGGANATLGFGKLMVVSGPGSPRRVHIQQQALITGLELTIPDQFDWTEADVANFRWPDQNLSLVGVGSVKAWLSHHLVLHAFLESGAETALIFEDDVDWDIRLRTKQIPLAQKAARQLGKDSKSGWSSAYPWGAPKEWDLLYLGHCGDYFGDVEEGVGVGFLHPEDLAKRRHVVYNDDTMLRRTDLHPFTASIMTAFDLPEHSRVLHQSSWPLCSFGYAITRSTAQRIINEVAPAKEDISRNLKAYDVALLAACRDSYLMNCYTLTPELFHHMEGTSLIGVLEEAERRVFRPPVDASGLAQTRWRGETANIGCGFWSGEFYYDETSDRLPFLQEEVGRKNRCLKRGRDPHGWFAIPER